MKFCNLHFFELKLESKLVNGSQVGQVGPVDSCGLEWIQVNHSLDAVE